MEWKVLLQSSSPGGVCELFDTHEVDPGRSFHKQANRIDVCKTKGRAGRRVSLPFFSL